MKKLLVLLFCASSAAADPAVLLDGARTVFPDLPRMETFDPNDAPCGMGAKSNPRIGYCATQRVLFLVDGFENTPNADYELAHVLGHYYQIRYGVADVALRTIRARREDEAALRGMVTRQVDCLAGVVTRASGLPFVGLDERFANEPMTDAHWGRSPINSGPRVSIGLEARAQWYKAGYDSGDVATCSVGEMSSDLLVNAQVSR